MNENGTTNDIDNEEGFRLGEVITSEVTTNIRTINDLWLLAKITKDIKGDCNKLLQELNGDSNN